MEGFFTIMDGCLYADVHRLSYYFSSRLNRCILGNYSPFNHVKFTLLWLFVSLEAQIPILLDIYYSGCSEKLRILE